MGKTALSLLKLGIFAIALLHWSACIFYYAASWCVIRGGFYYAASGCVIRGVSVCVWGGLSI